jgi:hypothetical protein
VCAETYKTLLPQNLMTEAKLFVPDLRVEKQKEM